MDATQAEILKATLHLSNTRGMFGVEGFDAGYLAERLWMNVDTGRLMVGGRSFFSTLVIKESLNAVDSLIEHYAQEPEQVSDLRRIGVEYGVLVEREEQPVRTGMVRDLATLVRLRAMLDMSMKRNQGQADPQALAAALGEARKLIGTNALADDDPFLGALVTEAEKATATLAGLAEE